MQREKNLTGFIALFLAFFIAYGAVGSMVTGLKLEVGSLWLLGSVCFLGAAFGSLCGRFRHGGWALLAASLMSAWYFYRSKTASGQFLAMLCRMSTLYDHAYGWGVIPAGEEILCDRPLMLIGCVAAVTVGWCVNRQKPAIAPFAAGLLPLCTCLVVTDTVPDSVFLFLLLWGLAVLLLTNALRRKDLGQGVQLTGMAGFIAAAGLGLLFWAVPRDTYDSHPQNMQDTLLSWFQDMPAMVEEVGQRLQTRDVQTAQPESENLRTLGDRIERSYAVLEVTAPFSGTMYLRGQDFDVYDGESWMASRHRTEDFPLNDYETVFSGDTIGTVTIETRVEKEILYLPYYTQPYTQLVGGRAENENGLKSYTYTQRVLPEGWQEAIAIPEVYDSTINFTIAYTPPEADNYRALPLETKSKAEEIVSGILTAEDTVTEKANAIAAYVRSSAVYSLSPGRMPGGEEDFALWFLRESETGYCVHFATAAAVLLRAAGIDARYVTGYILDARAGETVTVPAKQSHAWAEYYEPRLGLWIPLEATPGDLTGDEERLPTDPAVETESLPEPTQTTPAETETRSGEDHTEPDPTQDQKQQAIPGKLPDLGRILKWPLTAAILLLAVAAQRWLRLMLRRDKQRRGGKNARALALWQELELQSRLLGGEPETALEALAQKAKFSQHVLTMEELKVLEGAVAAGKLRLQELPRYKKLIHQYIFAAY